MNLDTFLRQKQMTEVQFAERAGISQSAVNKYRNSKRVPRPTTQVKI
ncbi:helix-turn-helix transcriptional regulator (plasmid) [Azospirillum sp. HJ39]